MSDWTRTTQAIPLQNIDPDLRAAIDAHLERHNLGDILSDAILCVQTASEQTKKKLFGGPKDKYVTEVAIITPAWLISVVKGNKTGVGVMSGQMADLNVTDYAQSYGYKLIPDSGLEVNGKFTGMVGTDGRQEALKFIGLGPEGDALRFRDAVAEVMAATRR